MFELPNYVQVPHEIFGRMPELSGQELKVLMAICRKTLGYHKLTEAISYSQIAEITKISRPHVVPAIKKLLTLDMIDVEHRKGKTNYYTLKCGCKLICTDSVQTDQEGVTNKGTEVLPIRDIQKKEDKESIDTSVSRGVPDPELKPLVRYFYDKHEEVRGSPPTPAWPRDMAIMKRLRVAGEYEPGAIRQCIDAFFAYPGRLKTGVRDFSNSIDNIYCYLQDKATGKIKWQNK